MGMSMAERLAALPRDQRLAWLNGQPDWLLEEMERGEWWWNARPEQIPPEGDWLIHLVLSGRGWGKSRSGSEWIVERVLKHPTDRHGVPTEHLVIAETLSDGRLICIEGPAGILRVLERRGIAHKYIKSPKPMITFPDNNNSKIFVEGADNADVGRGYNAASCWGDEICIAEGEEIVTARGSIAVEDVQVGDLVRTRSGWNPVTFSGLTRKNAEIVEIVTEVGTVLLTPNHRVWTRRGWVEASALLSSDSLFTWQTTKTQPHRPSPHGKTGTAKFGTTTREPITTTTETEHCSIAPFGPRSTALSRMDTKSITSTGTGQTTDWSTYKCSPRPSTGLSHAASETTRHGARNGENELPGGSSVTGKLVSPGMSSALSAEPHFSQRECAPKTAQMTVEGKGRGGMRAVPVISVKKVSRRADVYDLTVGGEPEFFAGSGSLLVHNCKWPKSYESWYEGIMPSLRADLEADHPRAYMTTTPKPIKILQEWIRRKDGTVSVVRGATFDNRSNLSGHMLKELETRYAGTTIGRQELYGELLEDIDGALFSRGDINKHRVNDIPDGILSTVVGVDPALTGEADEMGVVVVARKADNHMYVVADRSIMGAGRAAALHAWRVVAEYGADLLLYEDNIGKRWLAQVFRDAYYELSGLGIFPAGTTPPMKGIDTKYGKKTRAEPVAMRLEQGRLHFVGQMPDLEDQCALFNPETVKDSPDRMDAMVHACRHLMAAERRTIRVATPSDTVLKDMWQVSSYSV